MENIHQLEPLAQITRKLGGEVILLQRNMNTAFLRRAPIAKGRWETLREVHKSASRVHTDNVQFLREKGYTASLVPQGDGLGALPLFKWGVLALVGYGIKKLTPAILEVATARRLNVEAKFLEAQSANLFLTEMIARTPEGEPLPPDLRPPYPDGAVQVVRAPTNFLFYAALAVGAVLAYPYLKKTMGG